MGHAPQTANLSWFNSHFQHNRTTMKENIMASLYSVIVDLGRVGRKEIKITKELWEDLETVVARHLGIAASSFTVISHMKHDDQNKREPAPRTLVRERSCLVIPWAKSSPPG